jgi:hypothetical protein
MRAAAVLIEHQGKIKKTSKHPSACLLSDLCVSVPLW